MSSEKQRLLEMLANRPTWTVEKVLRAFGLSRSQLDAWRDEDEEFSADYAEIAKVRARKADAIKTRIRNPVAPAVAEDDVVLRVLAVFDRSPEAGFIAACQSEHVSAKNVMSAIQLNPTFQAMHDLCVERILEPAERTAIEHLQTDPKAAMAAVGARLANLYVAPQQLGGGGPNIDVKVVNLVTSRRHGADSKGDGYVFDDVDARVLDASDSLKLLSTKGTRRDA